MLAGLWAARLMLVPPDMISIYLAECAQAKDKAALVAKLHRDLTARGLNASPGLIREKLAAYEAQAARDIVRAA